MDSKRKSTFEYTEPAHDSLPKKILLWLLQVFGAVTAVLFGTFSILEWQNSENAATQADVANLVAFLSFCGDLRSNNGSGMVGLLLASGFDITHATFRLLRPEYVQRMRQLLRSSCVHMHLPNFLLARRWNPRVVDRVARSILEQLRASPQPLPSWLLLSRDSQRGAL